MEITGRLQQNERVIEDFTSRTLAAIPSQFGRLLYVACLRDLGTGRYIHEGLTTVYPKEAVQQALAFCHQQLYAKILETPLEQQEWDLQACVESLEGDFGEIIERWQEVEFYRLLAPPGVPAYLRDAFCSNLRTLLAVLAGDLAARAA